MSAHNPKGVPDIVNSSETLAGVFAALGDPTRLKLVAVLCMGGAFSIAQAKLTLEKLGYEWEQALGRLKMFVESPI
ncbi:MAG: hypothetical protein ABW044_13165 [Cellvibrio sp.]